MKKILMMALAGAVIAQDAAPQEPETVTPAPETPEEPVESP